MTIEKKTFISDLLNDSLTEYTYGATMAGLYSRISQSDYGLTVSFVVVSFIMFLFCIFIFVQLSIYVFKKFNIFLILNDLLYINKLRRALKLTK